MKSSLWSKCKNAFVIAAILSVVTIFINATIRGTVTTKSIQSAIFWSFYYGFSISMVNEFFFEFLSIKYPWEERPKARAWIGFMGSILATMLTLFTLNYIYWILYRGKDFSFVFEITNRRYYLSALGITIFISSIMHSLGFYKWAREEQVLNEKLRKEKVETELNVLKAHIDPHFLFNSFNILSGLIDENPTKAKLILDELSSFYRHILENRNDNIESIASEIDFAKQYLSIQQARFEDSIILNINISKENLERKIPSLSLQMLVENAIKHNSFDTDAPLKIGIKDEDNYLVIRNNKKERKNLIKGNGIGLQNIRDRYKLLTNQHIHIEESTSQYIVKLPIINKDNV